jgi:hypothetical protein
MKMTLAKALRVKNRLASKLHKKKSIVGLYNSYNEKNPPNYVIPQLLEDIVVLGSQLIELKTAISLANKGIAKQLHELEEAKSAITFLNEINRKEGTFTDYGQEPITFKVFMKDIEIAKVIEEQQDVIETIQDEINQFNTSTIIEVNFDI